MLGIKVRLLIIRVLSPVIKTVIDPVAIDLFVTVSILTKVGGSYWGLVQ